MHTRTAVHLAIGRIDRFNLLSQLGIGLGALTHRTFPPVVVATQGHLEFTRLYGDPNYSGEPITCAEATERRERSRRGKRELRVDQSDITEGADSEKQKERF